VSPIQPAGRVARFGAFDLDARTGELRKRGVRVRLQEQPFQLLAILIERAGGLVTRDEIRRRLWTASTTIAFDQAVNNAVAKIRIALSDSAESPRFVETLARRGYRFIEDIEWVGDPGDAPAPRSTAAPAARAAIVRLTTDDRTVVLTEGSHIVGRDPDVSVWIDSAVVSRHHARLVVQRDCITIEDLGSRNGTFVNGARVVGVSALAHGDQIRIATHALVVHVSIGKTANGTADIVPQPSGGLR
jgi:DNA-binding winged helix-turn-helix (wHTH) protein